jgi:hypothetical protein
MKKSLLLTGMALLAALQAQAQPIVMPPGKLAVFKAGDNNGVYTMVTSRSHPCYIQVFDPVTNNQVSAFYTLALPTNQPNGIFINAHAGSEGGGLSRTSTRQFLAIEGYTGNILSPTAAKPSADPTVYRGFGTIDAFGNEQVLYQDLANWFGLPPGVTQNNPTGIASTDGTNFWGTGNFAGTSFEDSGVLFFNPYAGGTPSELENYIQAAGQARIIGGTLYVVVAGGGVYNFIDPLNNDAVVPLPFDPNVPNPIEHPVLTNLFLNWGSTFTKVFNFDMNSAGTIAYGADQTKGIVKFTNSGGAWQQAPYFFSTTNIGTRAQTSGNQGCFGICVDFSGANPIIYATTMENGYPTPNTLAGHQNQNRIIRIVDTGVSPGTNLVAQTLSIAGSTNEFYGGIDFTPDLTPLITSQPANYATVGTDFGGIGTAFFSVSVDSVYALSYQWLTNGTPVSGATSATINLSGLTTAFDGLLYQCVVTNAYGAVTSTPALLTVTSAEVAPIISASTANVTAFVGGIETFAPVVPSSGTQPFTYQWYFGSTKLVDDGVKYNGSTTDSLSISNLVIADGGNYYLVASNPGGYASNLVDVLTVKYHLPTINAGAPVSVTTFVGYSTSLTAGSSGGTLPITNQWYKGTTALTDTGDFSGTGTSTLTINPAALGDAGSYKIVVSNPGGSVTSAVATVTVLVPPAHSFVSYSNQLYLQNFNSLPDPGSNSVNSINNPMDPGSIGTNAYSLANPFDFAYPVINGSFVGGLGLSNTLGGWYGAADTVFPGVDGITRFGAQDGDQSTGGVIDFGANDGATPGTNRALGLLSTSTTGSTSFGLKLVNNSGNTLNYVSLGFIGELWRNGTGQRVMSFGYTNDTTGTFSLTSESISNSTLVPGLAFSFPVNNVVVAVDGTAPANQIVLSTNNLALSTPWTPGTSLWLIWSIDFYGSGSGNGYAIDNLGFSASVNPLVQGTAPVLNGGAYTPGTGFSFSFTNVPSASFTVYTTPTLNPPNWTTLSARPVENPQGGYSIYNFTDTTATGTGQHYYKVSSP